MVYQYGYEHGYEKRKDHRAESQTEGKIQYFTLAILVAWNTLDTRGSTASHHHIEILKSCKSYHLTLFANYGILVAYKGTQLIAFFHQGPQ